MDNQSVQELINRYLRGKADEREKALLDNWYYRESRPEPLEEDDFRFLMYRESIWKGVRYRAGLPDYRTQKKRILRWLPYAVAAILLLFVGLLFFNDSDNNLRSQHVNKYDVAPGGNRATLTLANGDLIDLSERQSSIIIGNEVKYADGTLLKDLTGTSKSVAELVLATPKGGTYAVTLSDGTKIWLNAASTLRYPARFNSNKRIVELDGEAYFEVASLSDPRDGEKGINKSSKGQIAGGRVPFFVKTRGQTLEVLGTHFNVAAYSDENVTTTTLVEGSVAIRRSGSPKSSEVSDVEYQKYPSKTSKNEVVLKPGEQSVLSDVSVSKRSVDVSPFIAWKNGFLHFYGTDPQQAFNELSRWYDIEVIYEGKIPNVSFYGVITRDKSLSSVLDILRETGLEFRVETTGGVNKLVVTAE